MLKERREAVARVTADFLQAEAAIDQAARHAVACVSTMLDQRATARLPLDTGLRAIELMNEVTALLVKARQLAIETHGALAVLPEQIGVRGFGDTSPCPYMGAAEEPAAASHLRVVA